MNYENCELYGINRKRDLYRILRTTKKQVVLVLNNYKACINEKSRLLEKPSQDLKYLQRRLLNKLYGIDFPAYVFSGVKGKSSYGNAIEHLNARFMLKLDMSKFFPNTHRNNVYSFFKQKLKMSPDVAKLCTDITTINYNGKGAHIERDVDSFMKLKHIKNKNHLPSGTPTSQILSYLANLDMFDEIIRYCENHKLNCTIYVDDITISSNRMISFVEEKQLKSIIKKYGQRISKGKTIRYREHEYKKVTGFVIAPNHELVVANKTRWKIKQNLLQVPNIDNIECSLKNSLIGLANFSELSQKDAYKGLKSRLKQPKI